MRLLSLALSLPALLCPGSATASLTHTLTDELTAVSALAELQGHFSDPANPGCSALIEFVTPAATAESDKKNKNKSKKRDKKRDKESEQQRQESALPPDDSSSDSSGSGSRRAVILRSMPGDGEAQCYFNSSDSRLPPVPSVVMLGGTAGKINITSDFSAEGGSIARRGVLDLTSYPRQLIWEAEVTSSSHSSKSEPPDFGPAAVGESVKGNVHTKSTKGGSSTTSLALRAKATWQQLPFTGFYSDTRFPHCRRQLIAETLTRALLVGADAKTQVGGCDGHTDVMWQNRQVVVFDGARITVQYARRYSYSEEVWEQVRTMKREEANAMSGRELDDPLGDWWDKAGDVSGSLQYETGKILWDDGSVWERHDGHMHNKPIMGEVRVGGIKDSTRSQTREAQEQLSRERRDRKVKEMRDKAARQSAMGQKQTSKQKQKTAKTVSAPPKKKPLPDLYDTSDTSPSLDGDEELNTVEREVGSEL